MPDRVLRSDMVLKCIDDYEENKEIISSLLEK